MVTLKVIGCFLQQVRVLASLEEDPSDFPAPCQEMYKSDAFFWPLKGPTHIYMASLTKVHMYAHDKKN